MRVWARGSIISTSARHKPVPGFTQPGYKFTVEPQGPESLDTGDPSYDGSLPSAPPLLGSQENGSQADTAAISDLAADSMLASEPGLHGGSFDMADEMLLQMPGDASGMGDWLVPYDGSGGVNDVTGALMIDSDTGVIDEATWIDPAKDGFTNFSLANIDEWATDQASGNEPSDNGVPTPEPGSLLLLAAGGALFALRALRNLRGNEKLKKDWVCLGRLFARGSTAPEPRSRVGYASA